MPRIMTRWLERPPAPARPRTEPLRFLDVRDRFRVEGFELFYRHDREHYEVRGRRRQVLATVGTLGEAADWLRAER